jgi:hypothetical protein
MRRGLWKPYDLVRPAAKQAEGPRLSLCYCGDQRADELKCRKPSRTAR